MTEHPRIPPKRAIIVRYDQLLAGTGSDPWCAEVPDPVHSGEMCLRARDLVIRAVLSQVVATLESQMSDRTDFTPDPGEAARMAYHFGPDGPVAAVHAWLDWVSAGDFDSAWALMDDNLRLCRAQAWLWNNRSHPDIAALDLDEESERIAAAPSTSSLWPDFAITELDQLNEIWPHRFKAIEEGRMAAGSATRVLGPDLEVVLLMEGTGEAEVFDQPTLVPDAFIFTVRVTDHGWRVAAYDDFIPEPGWPPQFERPAG